MKPEYNLGDTGTMGTADWADNAPIDTMIGERVKLIQRLDKRPWTGKDGKEEVYNWEIEFLDQPEGRWYNKSAGLYVTAMPEDCIVLDKTLVTDKMVEQAKVELERTLKELERATGNKRFHRRIKEDREGKATVVCISYREFGDDLPAGGDDVLVHVSSDWEKAEAWIKKHAPGWAMDSRDHRDYWWAAEEVIDSDEEIFSTKEDRTYDQEGNFKEKMVHG